ncbi:hypothetical protein [Streptomyces curacoi]|uniref:Uncharacterized protein n=1 Tax=Streptomyces curacoi TaxID=146536 RepID=A0A117NUP1_9ACTN|nr:hypothetical protein [Streptomyces curacoi]KUM67699.1 hypothetical protein AQI70_35135 [Streptomyces curacoi]
MTTHGGEATNRPDETGGQPRSSGVSADELRAQFQAQDRQGLAEDSRRDARQARGVYAVLPGLVAVICLVLTVVRLVGGDVVGAWVALYAVGAALSGWGFVLARIGRTRWAMAVTCIGGALAGIGDSAAFR